MSKLLIVGLGPLPEKGERNFSGQCLRTWSFVEPLLRDGHAVRLVTLPIAELKGVPAALVRRKYEGLEYQSFTNSDFAFIHETLAQVARSFAPDALIGVNSLAAWVTAKLPLCVPMWADFYGYQMAEKQGEAARTQNDEVLFEAWKKEALTARRGDKFSTVSRPQMHALLAEMASQGRLNQHTFHYPFAHHVPAAYHPIFAEKNAAPAEKALRGKIVPPDAFVLLWSGGYNYWTNPDFLFEFVAGALRLDPRVHYVSAGGAIAGYNARTYDRFCERIENSDCRDRCHFLGWLPPEDLGGIYRETDLALNIDEKNYETFFGARTRINNLMAAGVPVLTTFGTEVSRDIEEAGCGMVCPPGDTHALIKCVLEAFREPERLRELGRRGRVFALEQWSPDRLIEPVREWARKPELAPDNAAKLRARPRLSSFLDATTNELEETAALVEKHGALEMRRDQADMEIVRRKKWYGVMKSLLRW